MSEFKLFDVINDISYKKEGLLKTPLTSKSFDEFDLEEFNKQYNPATINKALGVHPDALFILDAINRKGINPLIHHDIVFELLPARIRKGKWLKEIKDEKIQTISDYYGVRSDVASLYERLISKDKLKMMEETLKVD